MRVRLSAAALVAAVLASPASALGICVEGAYPPFSEVLDDGTIVGFDIDIAGALCGRIGETCTLVRTDWDRMIPALVGGDCDAIVASMSDTPERRARIAFTERYYRAPVRFVGLRDAALDDAPGALDGKAVGVQRGTVNQTYMRTHYPGARLRLYGSQEHVLLDLALGRLDAVLGEAAQLGPGFLETPAGGGFAFFGRGHFDPDIQGSGAAIGVRKEDAALLARLDEAIAAVRADGTYDTIARRYFDFDIYGG
jgi:lysine-arginine-ornithine-binding protein